MASYFRSAAAARLCLAFSSKLLPPFRLHIELLLCCRPPAANYSLSRRHRQAAPRSATDITRLRGHDDISGLYVCQLSRQARCRSARHFAYTEFAEVYFQAPRRPFRLMTAGRHILHLSPLILYFSFLGWSNIARISALRIFWLDSHCYFYFAFSVTQ